MAMAGRRRHSGLIVLDSRDSARVLLLRGCDHLLSVGRAVLDISDATLLRGGKVLLKVALVNAQEGHDQVLGNLLPVQDLLRYPEGERRDAGAMDTDMVS